MNYRLLPQVWMEIQQNYAVDNYTDEVMRYYITSLPQSVTILRNALHKNALPQLCQELNLQSIALLKEQAK